MIHLVKNNLDRILQLCERYGVHRLELFGSAAGDGSDSGIGDVDFLVEFRPGLSTGHADRYFGLLESLAALLDCPIDLLEIRAIKNPFLLQGIEATRTVLYAA